MEGLQRFFSMEQTNQYRGFTLVIKTLFLIILKEVYYDVLQHKL
jgi:hypothetical protein